MKLFIDCETYSELDLKSRGTYVYAANCEVMLVTYAIDDGPVQVWDLTAEPLIPHELAEAAYSGKHKLIAHNAMFDRAVFDNTCTIETKISDWQCTMVQAFSHGLPGSLDKLCEIYKIGSDKAKIKDGRRLIQLFCKPRPKNSKIRRATSETHPEDWAKFIEYAKSDIEAMRVLHKKMPKWNYPREPELSLWHLDQAINDRGVMIDRTMAESVLRAVDRAKITLADETSAMTGGELASTTQVQATIDYVLREHGVVLDGMTKAQVSKALDDEDIPEPVKELLRIRQQAGSSSTAKYTGMLRMVGEGDRVRGGIQFAGAARTRRAAGRGGLQVQNLPSRGLLPDWLIDEGIELMKLDAEDLVFPNVMHLASSAIRKTLIAAPGKKLCVSDLSNIEGRKVAWYANEEWKLQAFRDFDAGTGHDLYNLAYAKAFKVPVESVTKDQRAIGKVMELMLGYGGGVGAFVTGAAGYGFDLEKLADGIFETLPRIQVEEAYNFLEWCKDTKRPRYALSDKAFVTVDTLKRLWRLSNSATVDLWAKIQNAAELAILTREPQKVDKLTFEMKGAWLRIRLPSGRYLCYPFAKYDSEKGLSYYGIDQYTRQWQEIRTYSGKLLENCIAAGTEVLTDTGWLPIESVKTTHRIWDGVEWVKHEGLKYSGKLFTITVFGVRMTPEHLVLTSEGWKNGATAKGYNRFECRLPNRYTTEPFRKRGLALGLLVYLWGGKNTRIFRNDETKEARDISLLRMPEERVYRKKEHQTRHGDASGVLGLAEYGRPLQVIYTSGMEKLWGAWHNSLRILENVRELLEGHVKHLSRRLHDRTNGQCPRIFGSKLPMENAQKTGEQYAENGLYNDPHRNYIRESSREEIQDKTNDIGASFIRGLDGRESLKHSCNSVQKVYDIMNCGPRNRFVVRGSDGIPLIVHNCCQSSARDVLYDSMPRAEEAGFLIVLHVHDELVTETEKHKNVAELSQIMAAGEPWTKGLPLAAAGFESLRYKK